MIDAALLADVELFAKFDPDELDRIADVSSTQRLKRGDLIFEEGDDPSDVYVVTDGRIVIAKRSGDGRESLLALLERGDLFGEMSIFDGGGRSADARALEAAEVISIPNSVLREVFESRPELLWEVVTMLTRRLRGASNALGDSMFLDVTGRTAKRLLELAGDADEFTLPVTQEELAGMVGASRERVNKSLASFIRLGWIEQHGRSYRITDRAQLSRRAT